MSDLRIGECIQAEGRAVRVVNFEYGGDEVVYNIEVSVDHCYRIGEQGLLVHNVSIPTVTPSAKLDFCCGNSPGSGNISRTASPLLNSNIKGGVPAGYEGHHLIGVSEAEKSPIMRWAVKLGYNINHRNNGVAYPSYANATFKDLIDGQKESCTKKLPLHKGNHSEAKYTGCVTELLLTLQNDYISGSVTDGDLCASIKKIENKIRRDLKAHRIWLNRFDPWTTPTTLPCSPTKAKDPACKKQ